MLSVHGCPMARLGEKDAGGMNVYVRELSRALGRLDIHVDIFTRCQEFGSTHIHTIGPNVRLIHLEAGEPRWIAKSQLFPFLPQFTEHVEGFRRSENIRYDIIHAHYWLSGWVGLRLRRLWDVPFIQMFHTLGALKNAVARSSGEMEPQRRLLGEREVVAGADFLVAANPLEFGHLVDLYGADPRKVRVVPCGVDIDLFHPIDQETARDYLALRDGQYIIFVGRLEPLKGVDVLLKALSALLEKGRNVRLLVAGGNLDGEEAQRLKALADECCPEGRVRFLGPIEQKELPYYYAAADVCAVPSFYESFGMVAIEAMACGVPVVASRAGGLQFTVRDGEVGLLAPPGDVQGLAAGLEAILGDPALRQRLGQAGVQLAHTYSWDSVARSITSLYGDANPQLKRILGEKVIQPAA